MTVKKLLLIITAIGAIVGIVAAHYDTQISACAGLTMSYAWILFTKIEEDDDNEN